MVRRITLILAIVCFAAACSKQIKVPPETLYVQGEKLFAKEDYDSAAEKWRKAKDTTTSQKLRTVLELKLADALFYDENYIEAAVEYENFRNLHPKNLKAPYALYMLGLSNFSQVDKVDIDQTPVNNAAILLKTFIQKYPQSGLVPKVREKLVECKTRQAAYEIYVGRFYYRTDKYGAAIGRLEGALKNYPGTIHNDEALYLLGNAYLRIGNTAKAKESLSRLVSEYPKSEYINDAKDILSENS